jgi:hypothetical protein
VQGAEEQSMSRTAKVGIVVLAIIALPAIAFLFMTIWMAPPDDLDLAREKRTAGGTYDVSISPEVEPFERGTLHAWIVTVRTPGGEPVEDATLTIDGGMPQHGHGLPTAPAVTAVLGDGRYRVEGVRFNMGGWWEFKVNVAASAGEDNVTFNLSF